MNMARSALSDSMNKRNESFLEQLQTAHVQRSIFCLVLTESLSEQEAVI